jgi:hypothetical protein
MEGDPESLQMEDPSLASQAEDLCDVVDGPRSSGFFVASIFSSAWETSKNWGSFVITFITISKQAKNWAKSFSGVNKGPELE